MASNPLYLSELLAESAAKYAAMSPAEKAQLHEEQRESWARGEIGMGNDAREARWRDFYLNFVDPCDCR